MTIEGIKEIRGLTCNDKWLFLSVAGAAVNGVYVWDFAQAPELSQVFSDSGLIEAADSGVIVSHGALNEPAALALVDLEGTATDMGFANEQLEIRSMNVSDGKLFTFSKDWSNAHYMVHRALLPDGGFQQVGGQFVATGMSMHATPSTVYVLVTADEGPGAACFQADATGAAEVPWEACPTLPDYSGADGGPYSVVAELYGHGDQTAAWFRVSDKGKKSWKHQVNGPEGWAEVGGFPEIEPSIWFHDGQSLFVGYADGGAAALYQAENAPGATAQTIGDGLPSPGDKSGVEAMCLANDTLYAAWFEYNPGGSTVTLWQREF